MGFFLIKKYLKKIHERRGREKNDERKEDHKMIRELGAMKLTINLKNLQELEGIIDRTEKALKELKGCAFDILSFRANAEINEESK